MNLVVRLFTQLLHYISKNTSKTYLSSGAWSETHETRIKRHKTDAINTFRTRSHLAAVGRRQLTHSLSLPLAALK